MKSWILRQSRNYRKPTRMIAKHHDNRWTKLVTNCNPAISTKQKRYPKQERHGKTTSTCTYNQPDPTETTTISRATRPGSLRSKWDAMESDFKSSRLKQPTRPRTPLTTTTTTQPTTHDQTKARLKLTTKTEATQKTTTSKTTTIRYSSFLNS